jgi:hypothetical protein
MFCSFVYSDDVRRKEKKRDILRGTDVEFPSVVPIGRPHDGISVRVVLDQSNCEVTLSARGQSEPGKGKKGNTLRGAAVEFPSVVPTGRPHDAISVRVVLNQIVRLGCRRARPGLSGEGKDRYTLRGTDVEFPSVVPAGRPHDGILVRVVLNHVGS